MTGLILFDFGLVTYIKDKKVKVTLPSAKGDYALVINNITDDTKTVKSVTKDGEVELTLESDKVYKVDLVELDNMDKVLATTGNFIDRATVKYNVSYTEPDSGEGTITADNSVTSAPSEIAEGTEVTFTFAPGTDKKLKAWKVNNTVVEGETSNTFTLTVTEAAVVSVDVEDAETYIVTFKVQVDGEDKADAGEIKGHTSGNSVVEGTEVKLIAEAKSGYKFVNWTVDGEEVGTGSMYKFVPTKDVEVIANFAEDL